jgi:hypothetical protein
MRPIAPFKVVHPATLPGLPSESGSPVCGAQSVTPGCRAAYRPAVNTSLAAAKKESGCHWEIELVAAARARVLADRLRLLRAPKQEYTPAGPCASELCALAVLCALCSVLYLGLCVMGDELSLMPGMPWAVWYRYRTQNTGEPKKVCVR